METLSGISILGNICRDLIQNHGGNKCFNYPVIIYVRRNLRRALFPIKYLLTLQHSKVIGFIILRISQQSNNARVRTMEIRVNGGAVIRRSIEILKMKNDNFLLRQGRIDFSRCCPTNFGIFDTVSCARNESRGPRIRAYPEQIEFQRRDHNARKSQYPDSEKSG